jgi:hypothetical protein
MVEPGGTGWAVRAGVSLALLVGLAAAPARAQGQPEQERVLDRVVAVVRLRGERDSVRGGTDLITLSDLEFETAVALIGNKATEAATKPLDAEALKGALDYAIAERLLTQEADRLNAFQIEPAELDDAVGKFEAKLPRGELDRFLARFDQDRPRLRAVIERGLRAAKAIDAKVRLRAQVSEVEVRRFFDAHAQDYPGRYEDYRSNLKKKLFDEKYKKIAGEVTKELRENADVRIIARIGEGP